MAHSMPLHSRHATTEVGYGAPVVRTRWVFPLIAAVLGGALFVAGLVGVFRVNFDSGWFTNSADVMGYGISPALAVATLLLGGAVLVAALADRDQGSTAFLGFLTILVAIAGVVLEGRTLDSDTGTVVQFDRNAGWLLAIMGAVIFAVGLVPWLKLRRERTVVRYDERV